jgi:plastocyanin
MPNRSPPQSNRPARVCAVLGSLVLLCAGGAARAETITVAIKVLSFVPPQVQAKVGDTIAWRNQDFLPHTATAQDKSWEVVIEAHKTGEQVMSKPGVFQYYCRFHPNMRGTITVAPQ